MEPDQFNKWDDRLRIIATNIKEVRLHFQKNDYINYSCTFGTSQGHHNNCWLVK